MIVDLDGIDDFHVHLRQDSLMQAVTPHLSLSGVRTAYVMVRPMSRLDLLPFSPT